MQQISVRSLDYAVALAGGGLQSLSIKNENLAAAVLNQTGAFQAPRCACDADAIGAKGVGKTLVGKRQPVYVQTILNYEQDTSKALKRVVKAIAGGCLHYLHEHGASETYEREPQRRVASTPVSQYLDRYDPRGTCDQHDAPMSRQVGIEECRRPDYALDTHHAHSYTRPFLGE